MKKRSKELAIERDNLLKSNKENIDKREEKRKENDDLLKKINEMEERLNYLRKENTKVRLMVSTQEHLANVTQVRPPYPLPVGIECSKIANATS